MPFEYDDEVNIGDSIELFCQISKGDVPIIIEWKFLSYLTNSSELNENVKIAKTSKKSSLLSVSKITQYNSGNYTCKAQNKGGSTSFTTSIVVKGKICCIYNIFFFYKILNNPFHMTVSPKVTPFTFGNAKNYGSFVSIQCVLLEGDFPVKFEWFFGDEKLENGQRGIFLNAFDLQVSNLMIKSVNEKHIGNYSCIIKNKAGMDKYTASLDVIGTLTRNFNFIILFCNPTKSILKFVKLKFLQYLVAPKIAPFSFGSPKNFGTVTAVQCILQDGELPVKFQWLFNNNKVENNENGIFINELGPQISNLMITSVDAIHMGNFTCLIKNRAGFDSYTASLEVIGIFSSTVF